VVLTPERVRKLYAALGETTHADEQLDAEGAGASGDFVEGRSAAIAAPEIQKTEAEDRRIVRILIIVSPSSNLFILSVPRCQRRSKIVPEGGVKVYRSG